MLDEAKMNIVLGQTAVLQINLYHKKVKPMKFISTPTIACIMKIIVAKCSHSDLVVTTLKDINLLNHETRESLEFYYLMHKAKCTLY